MHIVVVYRTRTSEACSEPCQISKVEYFAKIINGFYPSTVFTKCSDLDVWQVSKYASVDELRFI